jgi:hypothetical protein
MKKRLYILLFIPLYTLWGIAQELNCKVSINSSQIQGTNKQVFESLANTLTEFINDKKWTNLHYSNIERIKCNLTLTVKEYSDEGHFVGDLMIQSSRPVYNASYTTPVFNFKDNKVSFDYMEQDQLEFNPANIDNNLTAIIAYYVYFIIGLDRDTMAPMGGTAQLQFAENIVAAAQTMSDPGWKAFEDNSNRHGLISDYLDESMQSMRQLYYDYHRKGLDEMVNNANRGRAQITTALKLLDVARENRAMSYLPQLFTDIKKEELLNIYSKGTNQEKEEVYTILQTINPSKTTEWDKIKSQN